jgi:hypothetical protein
LRLIKDLALSLTSYTKTHQLCFAGMHLDSSPAALQHVSPLAMHAPRLATCKEKKNKLEKGKRFNKGNKHDETTKGKAVARLCSVAVKSMGALAS